MKSSYYSHLSQRAQNLENFSSQEAQEILSSKDIELLPLLNAAYTVRKNFLGKSVTIHIINNGANGYCPEDCHYCVQAKSSKADIEEYPLKSDDEFLAEAKNAYEKGAHRYCMVFAGRGPSNRRTEHLARLVKEIKSAYPLEVCVSAGLLDEEKAQILAEAGLDRLNHNLNTSEKHYHNICTTHTFQDRLNTLSSARKAGIQLYALNLKCLSSARKAGIQLCSGVIIGMEEDTQDIIDVGFKLREMGVESIPVNFLIPIEGNQLDKNPDLTPEFCLRVLCLYRFLNPKAEIRIAAGRELHLRSMEVMALYPANSLFLDGYLNAKGSQRRRTYQMICDAGFTIESDHNIEDLIDNEVPAKQGQDTAFKAVIKELSELRPALTNSKGEARTLIKD